MSPIELTPAERAGKIAGTHLLFIVAGTDYRDASGRYYRFETALKSALSRAGAAGGRVCALGL
jgi:hypothetical protein